jgi:hypothetical protein
MAQDKTSGNAGLNKPAPPVIDTQKLTGATQDPRGDNRPGVIPDQPAEDGLNPITNLPEAQMSDDGVTPRVLDATAAPINPPIPPKAAPAADAKAPKGRNIELILDRDYWPRTRPADVDPDAEYRVRAGEKVSLPSEEAMDLMEAGIGKRADRRA